MQFACFYSCVFSVVPTASHCLCDGEYFIATHCVREESLPSVINSCNERCSEYRSVPDTRPYLVHLQVINCWFFCLFYPRSSPLPPPLSCSRRTLEEGVQRTVKFSHLFPVQTPQQRICHLPVSWAFSVSAWAV